MATTATITLSSDITPGFGGITKSMTLTQAATTTDIEETTGFSRRKLTATTLIDLVTVGAQMYGTPTASKANKLYIKNTGSSTTDYIDVAIGDSETDANAEKNAGIPLILLEDGYTEKKTTEIYHNHLVKDFVGIEKIVLKYL